MKLADKVRTIVSANARPPATLALGWSDGTRAEFDLGKVLRDRAFAPLRDAAAFADVSIGEWGHSIEWAAGPELGAETLWLMTLSAIGQEDTRTFIEWRLRHGLSLTRTAEALGLSRRMVAYYSNGEKPVPRAILLACKGWEAERAA